VNLAQLMLRNLDRNNTIYVEYSNELWNFASSQGSANQRAANDSVFNHDDPFHFNYDILFNTSL